MSYASNQNKSNGSTVTGIGFVGLLQVAFIVLKLLEKINWSWWWVWAPTWISAILWIVLIVVIVLFACRKK